MLKRIFATFLLAVTLLIIGAQDNRAEAYWAVVVNCREWISLRATPSTEAECLAEIPLGDWVWINRGTGHNGFVSAEYNGIKGYVLEAYTKYVKD